ncbi:hypothetical protein RhiirA5_353927 [Rhizophagus irregularis]|uniref:Uncharacterized protein n=2 Tax=Rhizophagus irregularis TaxID=588596 RepID=A0A2N0PXX7_9GLOM|nr:hypothetical protein RhiirA5_353927 [Rhizophagus irregularis]GBC22967.1 hypothetical protein RIR_e22184_A0A2N0PXX7_9GLOM [Rhizophagus irregularis DAOM 181602=DAOM 197198]
MHWILIQFVQCMSKCVNILTENATFLQQKTSTNIPLSDLNFQDARFAKYEIIW